MNHWLYNRSMEEYLRQPPEFDPPLMNAASSLGFAPDLRLPLDWGQFGAFVTNPVSIRPRKPASKGRWQTFPGGALVHSGLPNPGFRQVARRYSTQWAQSPLPVIVHLLADRPDELRRRVEHLEMLENVRAVEIGFPDEISVVEAREVILACVGELAVIARVPFRGALPLAEVCLEAGAVLISISPPRGSLPAADRGAQSGRMYGPAVFPLALQAVRHLAAAGIPVIGAGGVYQQSDVDAMRQSGALAVQVDLALWRGDWFLKEDA
jgi:dihydroorotate dehydrogenase